MTGSIQQSRMLIMLLLAGGLILLALVAADLEGDLPNLPHGSSSGSTTEPLPVAAMTNVFEISPIPLRDSDDGEGGLFATSYFKPPKKDPPKKAPPEPTSRQLSVLYQGMIENSEGRRIAFLELDGKRMSLETNMPVVGEWTLQSIEPGYVQISRSAGENQRVDFRGRGTLEIPNP